MECGQSVTTIGIVGDSERYRSTSRAVATDRTHGRERPTDRRHSTGVPDGFIQSDPKSSIAVTHPTSQPDGSRLSDSRRLSRRSAIAGAGVAVAASLAGCLGGGDSTGTNDNVVLDVPEKYDTLEGANIDFPIHGEKIPDATVPDVVTGNELSPRDFVGDRHTMLTFVFTNCAGACPALTSNLVQVQAEAAENGFSDEIALLEYTFDPENDTEALFFDEYADDAGIDLDIGNWHFLRPESESRAGEVVAETFGVWFEYLTEEEREDHFDDDHMVEHMFYLHENLIFLVNEDGYVERAYRGEPPSPATVIDDVNTLRERW